MSSRVVAAVPRGFAVLTACVLLAACIVLAGRPPAAHAAAGVATSAALPGVVSQTPVGTTPDASASSSCGTPCANSAVVATAVVGGEVVAAGAFNQVCTPTNSSYAQCPQQADADFLFAYNLATGAIDPDFNPVFNAGPINALVAGPNDTVYVGGGFKTVNGTAARGIAELYVTPGQSSTDGALVPGFAAQTDGVVNNLAVSGNALYIGGQFSKVDGKDLPQIARVNATTGAADTSFSFTLGDPVSGYKVSVDAMSLSGTGSLLAIAGPFLTVNGQSTPRLALINTGGALGAASSLANWSAPILANNCSHQHNYINGLDISADGSFLVIGDTGYTSATSGTPSVCDAVARFPTTQTGAVQPTWINFSGGDTFHSVVVAGSVVYTGGHNRWLNNQCGNNSLCENNAVLVNGLGAIDASTGLALPWWHPETARGVGIESLEVIPAGAYSGFDGGLLIGANTDIIAGQAHDELAMFPVTSASSSVPGGPIPTGVLSDGRVNNVANRCLDDAGDSSAAGTTVQLSICFNDDEQNWTVGSDGTITIHGQCLDVSGGGTVSGQHVVINPCTGDTSQQWAQGTGDTLVNQAAGLCLDDPGANMTNNIALVVESCDGKTSQIWPLPAAPAPPPPPPAGPVYSAKEQTSGDVACLSYQGGATAGVTVETDNCYGYAPESWTAESNGTLQDGGLCLDTQGEATAPSTTVVLSTCTGSATQTWTPGPYWTLVNAASGLCLSLPGSTPANGTQPELETCPTSTNITQEWRLPTT